MKLILTKEIINEISEKYNSGETAAAGYAINRLPLWAVYFPKMYIITVTDSDVKLIRLKTFKIEESHVENIPLDQIQSIEVRNGLLAKKLLIYFNDPSRKKIRLLIQQTVLGLKENQYQLIEALKKLQV